MSTDPTSGNPSEFAAVRQEKAWYIGQYLSAVFLGAQITLVIQSTYCLANGSYPRPKKAFFIVYGLILVFLVAIGDCANQIQSFRMWITHRDMPGGPEAYVATHVSGWITVWSSAAVVAANFMGDALLLYRCCVLLVHNRLLVVLPALLLTASATLAILAVIESTTPNTSILLSGRARILGVPWVAITIVFNVVVTTLICGRIFFTYLSIRRSGVTFGAETWGVIAILIESALPFSLFGIIFAVSYGTTNPYVSAFADIWGNILGLTPQLIILRVAMGHAWTKNSISVRLEEPIQFNRGSSTGIRSDNSAGVRAPIPIEGY